MEIDPHSTLKRKNETDNMESLEKKSKSVVINPNSTTSLVLHKDVVVDGRDTNRDSRQLPVYGFDAMKKMSQLDVMVVGCGGLGIEVGNEKILH